MSQNKRLKTDLGAACSSASVNTQEMSTSTLDDGGDAHIAQQTTRADYRAGSRSTNENEKKSIFQASKSDFREAVKWTGFVDRSLLIKKLLSETEDRVVIICAPRRFGKSMNLNMVKRFLEIEGDRDVTNAPQDLKELEKCENFEAFHRYELKQPCKILAETDLVKEHFGRHPVLHIDFKDVEVCSIQDVENSVRRVVHFAYRAHSYLKNGEIFSDSTKNENAYKNCGIWCYGGKYKNENPIEGLQQLIEYLHAYHKRKVYLLVDEFDAPAVHALLSGKSGDEVKNINNQITALLAALVKEPEAEEHLLGSLITGVSYLGSVGISEHLNNVSVYKWLLDDTGRFAAYYGLSHNELTTLLEQVFPNQEQEQKRVSIEEEVKDLYNGYSFQGESVYCLWSVLHYIKERSRMDALKFTKKIFWGNFSIISEMDALLKNSDIMIAIMNVIGDGYISFSPCAKVDAQELANFLQKNECSNSNIVFSFFLEQGNLTRVPDQRENVCCPNKQICVTIPSAVEVLVAFRKMFSTFSETICGLSYWKMIQCAQVFKDLPVDRDDEICKKKLEDFSNHLEELLQRFNGQEGVNKLSLQAVLYATMLITGFKECCTEKYVTIDSETSKIDLWLYDHNFAIIFEMKHIEFDDDDSLKESAQKALEEILSGSETEKVPYVKILDRYSNTKNYLLIGISMKGKGKPYMCCLVNSLNDKDCIFFPEDD